MKILYVVLGCVALLFGLACAHPAHALAPMARPLVQFADCGQQQYPLFGFPSWDSCLKHVNGEIVITDLNDLWLIAFPIVETLMRAAGYVAVGMIIWGAILFIKSQGESGKVAAARDTIRNAIIGLVISIASVGIIQFVAQKF